MKKPVIIGIITLLAVFAAALIGGALLFKGMNRQDEAAQNKQVINSSMLVTSPSFENNAYIPQKFTCDGGNINPELDISGVPEGAVSLALIMHDPDAPLIGGFTHWLVWNIGPHMSVIKEESVPPGAVEGKNGSGKIGYTAPCPPKGHGIHHYHFTIYALSAKLELTTDTDKNSLEVAMGKYLLTESDLVGLYQRK
jgi:Raf kinase inhibitor-like YbhB/YbcL family protein